MVMTVDIGSTRAIVISDLKFQSHESGPASEAFQGGDQRETTLHDGLHIALQERESRAR